MFKKYNQMKWNDCIRASIATVMQWDPLELPNFAEFDNWREMIEDTFKSHGYRWNYFSDDPTLFNYINESPTGWLVAAVPSLNHDNSTHAIVVDNSLNLVHDPSNNKKYMKLNKEDIIIAYPVLKIKE